MQVNFRTYNPNFTALDIPKITKSSYDAELFETYASDNIVQNTKENADDLLKAIKKATDSNNIDIAFILRRVAKSWGLVK